jgi:hypothetical protein
MHISDRWLLVSDSRTSAWQSLTDYLEGMPAKWTRVRRDTIEAFSKKDHAAVRELLEARIPNVPAADRAIPSSLLQVLRKTEEWSPLSVLASAFLLFGPGASN